MMEMGLIFLNSAFGVMNTVGTAKAGLSPSSVVRVEPRRGVGQANPSYSYPRDGSPRRVMPPEVRSCSAHEKSYGCQPSVDSYRKPTQVGEESILRRVRELQLRNSAKYYCNFGRR